jgi:hypothetical protein
MYAFFQCAKRSNVVNPAMFAFKKASLPLAFTSLFYSMSKIKPDDPQANVQAAYKNFTLQVNVDVLSSGVRVALSGSYSSSEGCSAPKMDQMEKLNTDAKLNKP